LVIAGIRGRHGVGIFGLVIAGIRGRHGGATPIDFRCGGFRYDGFL